MNRQDAKNAKMERDQDRSEPAPEVDALAHAVIGAVIEVHRLLGPGFLEAVYEQALCIELAQRGIPFARQAAVAISYKGHTIGKGELDLLVGGKLIIELKTVDRLAPIHTAQLLSYLKTTDLQLGLLVNFNVTLAKDGIRRVVLS